MSKKLIFAFMMCALLVFGLMTTGFADITVSVVGSEGESTIESSIEERFPVNIKIDLGDASLLRGVGAFEFKVLYDASILAIDTTDVELGMLDDDITPYLAVEGRIPTHGHVYDDGTLDSLIAITVDGDAGELVFACATLPALDDTSTTNGAKIDGYLAQLWFTAEDTTGVDSTLLDLVDVVDDNLILINPAAGPLEDMSRGVVDIVAFDGYVKVSGALTSAYSLTAGAWNMISLAVQTDKTVAEIFNGEAEACYAYEGGYILVPLTSTLELGKGYWLKLTDDASGTYEAIAPALNSYTKENLAARWHIIGGIHGDQCVVPTTDPPNAIEAVYYYDGGYIYVGDKCLEQAKGYWVKLSVEATVTMQRGGSARGSLGKSIASMTSNSKEQHPAFIAEKSVSNAVAKRASHYETKEVPTIAPVMYADKSMRSVKPADKNMKSIASVQKAVRSGAKGDISSLRSPVVAWQEMLHAVSPRGGFSDVFIGQATEANIVPAPPYPPGEYYIDVRMRPTDFGGGTGYGTDVRAIADNTTEEWILEVKPAGNAGFPMDYESTISWDAGNLGNGLFEWIAAEKVFVTEPTPGFVLEYGETLIPDMKAQTEITVSSQPNAINYYVVRWTKTVAQIEANPESLDFRQVPLNTPREAQVTISNPGTEDLVITNIAITGSDESVYTPPAVPGDPISAGGSVDLTVTFTPTDEVIYDDATMVISSNADDTSELNIPLSGEGVTNPVTINPSSLEFDIAFGGSGSEQLTMTNAFSDAVTYEIEITQPTTPTPFKEKTSPTLKSTSLLLKRSSKAQKAEKKVEIVVQKDAINGDRVSLRKNDLADVGLKVQARSFRSSTATKSAGSLRDVEVIQISEGLSGSIPGSGQATLTVQVDVSSLDSHGNYDGNIAVTVTDNVPTTYDPINVAVNITVLGAAIAVEPTTYDFEEVEEGQSESHEFVITNNGNSDLTINSLSLADDEYFEITNPTTFPVTVAGGSNTPFSVNFSPPIGSASEVQPLQGQITISSDAYNTIDPVNVSGTAITISRISVSPTEHDFGSANIYNNDSQPQTITVENIGTGTFDITNVYIDGDDALEFAHTWGEGRLRETIGTFSVSFTPTSAGPKTATLHVVSDADSTVVNEVTLTGTAVAEDIEAPESLAFGQKPVGESYTDTVTISNAADATADLTISSIEISGEAFTYEILTVRSTRSVESEKAQKSKVLKGSSLLREDITVVLAPGEEWQVEVTFSPLEAGPYDGSLEITSSDLGDDTDDGLITIDLTGEGILCPDIAVVNDVTEIAFGETPALTPLTQSVTVSNGGAGALRIWPSITGDDAFDPSGWDVGEGYVIAAGGTMDIGVVFNPVDFGSYTATLTIESNADSVAECGFSGDADPDIDLTGTGTASDVALAINDGEPQEDLSDGFEFAFAEITALDESGTVTLNFLNRGNINLTGDISLPEGTEFSLDATTLDIASEGSQAVTLTFSPIDTIGTRTVTLTVTTNDANESSFDIVVTAISDRFGVFSVDTELDFSMPTVSDLVNGFDYNLQVQNIGGIAITNITVTEEPDVDWLTIDTYPTTIAGQNGTGAIELNIDPSALDLDTPFSTSLEITGDYAREPVTVSVTIEVLTFFSSADFNNDNVIEALDLLILLYAYNSHFGDIHWNERVDLATDVGGLAGAPTGDNNVDFPDLVLFALGYGTTEAATLPPTSMFVRSNSYIEFRLPETNEIHAKVGDEIRVPINVEAEHLFACEFELTFDTATLEYVGLAEGRLLRENNPTFFKPTLIEEDRVNVATSQLGQTAGASGETTIAEAIFRVRAEGNTTIEISNITSVDPSLSRIVPNKESITGNLIISSELPTEPFSATPSYYGISQNFPNPFNPRTEIQYQLPNRTYVTLGVYNTNGQLVKMLEQGEKDAGYHFIEWNGTDNLGGPVSSGVYFYTIVADDYTATKRMVLLK